LEEIDQLDGYASRKGGLKEIVIKRLVKYVRGLCDPRFWPAILRGVMPTMEHSAALRRLDIRTILDVGANKGQFSVFARSLFPKARIYAFEPLSQSAEIFAQVVREPVVLFGYALGAGERVAEFFVASRDDSSSLYRPNENQRIAFGVSLAGSVKVKVMRFDDVNLDLSSRPVLLKLDVQGGELDVLNGMTKSLASIDFIYVEVSFVSLYGGQPLAGAVVSFLEGNGFQLAGVYNQAETALGVTQADFLFKRDALQLTEVK